VRGPNLGPGGDIFHKVEIVKGPLIKNWWVHHHYF
jgi:hypothetical protein